MTGFLVPRREKVRDPMIEGMHENAGILARFMNEPEFQNVAFRELARKIYEGARAEHHPPRPEKLPGSPRGA